jgi:hypothetical protein
VTQQHENRHPTACRAARGYLARISWSRAVNARDSS